MNYSNLRSLALLPLVLTLLVATGCGTARYENRMQARLVGLRHLAKFRTLNEVPSQLLPAPGELTIRLPIRSGVQFMEISMDDRDPSQKIDPRRLQPPFLPLPGFRECYEQPILDNNKNQLPYTMYVAADKPWAAKKEDQKQQPPKEGEEKIDVEHRLTESLLAVFPEGKFEWQDFICDSPEPSAAFKDDEAPTFGTVKWRTLEVASEQEFYRIPDGGNPGYEQLPGILKLFLYEQKENEKTVYFVLLAWRVPQKLLDENKILLEGEQIPSSQVIDHQMKLIGGTIKIEPPKAPGV